MQRIQPFGCGGCGSEDRRFFHHVRLRGIYRLLCTSCVLKYHPGLFCPICFEVYEGPLFPSERVLCVKCPSVTHLSCVTDDVASSFVCPPCSDAAFLFLDGGLPNKKCRLGDGGESISTGIQKAIDVKSAKVIVAAARIAFVSMSKAALAARAEAERRVKEAALARKRAREALERLATLSAKEAKETVRGSGPVLVMEKQKKSKGDIAVTAAAMASQKRLIGFHASNVSQRPLKNGVSVTINNGDRVKGSPVAIVGHQKLQEPVTMDKKKKSSSLTQVQDHAMQGKKEKTEAFSVPRVAKGPPRKSHGMESKQGNMKVNADSGVSSRPPRTCQGHRL